MNTIYRTDDTDVLEFTNLARDNQPDRESLFEIFLHRQWKCREYDSRLDAVKEGLELERVIGEPFVWLCVTNDGARRICTAALELLGLGDYIDKGFLTDPSQAGALLHASPGVVVRLTRNIDKDRGYGNGAVGVVRREL